MNKKYHHPKNRLERIQNAKRKKQETEERASRVKRRLAIESAKIKETENEWFRDGGDTSIAGLAARHSNGEVAGDGVHP